MDSLIAIVKQSLFLPDWAIWSVTLASFIGLGLAWRARSKGDR